MSTAAASLRSNVANVRRLLPNWAWGLIWIALAIAYPTIIENVMASPDDLLDASIQTLAFIIMALGLNIVVGFAGLLDLGYVAFYAIGAFVVGWLGSQQFADVNGGEGIHILVPGQGLSGPTPGIHVNFFFVIFIAAAFTAIWGVILGAPTLRLRGDYLAVVTLAFGEIVPRVFENATSGIFGIGSTDFSNGRQGITPIDKINLPWSSQQFSSLDLEKYYYVGLAMVILVIWFNVRLRDSRLGRAWIAVREDEVAAAAMGVNLVRTKLWAYALGAALGGFSGVFLGSVNNTVNVDQFEFGLSVFILSMVIIGGMGNIWGVILGAVVLSMLNRFGLPKLNSVPETFGLDFDVTSVNFGIFGFFLLAMMVLRPEGFLPSSRRKLELREAEIDEADHIGAESDHELYEVRQVMTEQRTEAAETAAANGGGALLDASHISKVFGGLVAVNDVEFRVPPKSIVSLIGPNGAGKTTFFNCLTGLYRPTTGRVTFDGRDITAKRADLVTRAGIARTFQNIKLFRTMTAIENVQVGMHSQLRSRFTGMVIRTPFNRREERESYDKSRELLNFVGLKRHGELAMNLPYGDQRRLEIARALGSGPKLLLLDEPTAGMNPQESEELRRLMETLRSERDVSVLLIEHDMKVVMNVSDHITVLDHGEKIAEGSPAEVRANPRVIEAYLGSQA